MRTTFIACGITALLALVMGAGVASAFYRPRLELAQARVEQLGNDVREQNSAITRLREDTEKRKARVDKAMVGAAAARGDHERRAADLMDTQPVGEDCKAIDALLRKGLGQ